jgi:hypothetical protein
MKLVSTHLTSNQMGIDVEVLLTTLHVMTIHTSICLNTNVITTFTKQ